MGIALSLVGEGEDGANNRGPFIDQIFRREGASANWCAAFVSYCFEEAFNLLGRPMPFERSGGAKKLYRRIGNAGEFLNRPEPGAVVCFDRGKPGSWQGHIGIVCEVVGNSFVSIEGNVGSYQKTRGAVSKIEHDLTESKIEGFAKI